MNKSQNLTLENFFVRKIYTMTTCKQKQKDCLNFPQATK